MDILAIDILEGRNTLSAERGGGSRGDLFAGFLRGAELSAEPADGPAPAAKPPAPPRTERAERPERSEGAEGTEPVREAARTDEPGAISEDEARPDESGEVMEGEDPEREETAAADESPEQPATDPETEPSTNHGNGEAAARPAQTGAAMVAAHANGDAATLVVSRIANGEPRTPGLIGEMARTTAVPEAVVARAPAAATAARPAAFADAEALPEAAANRQAASGRLPVPVTVTQEEPPLVSRPSAALAPDARLAAMEDNGQAAPNGGGSRPGAGLAASAFGQAPVAKAVASTAAPGAAPAQPGTQALSAETLAPAPAGPNPQGPVFAPQAGSLQQVGGAPQAAVQTARPAVEIPASFEQVAMHLQKAAGEGLDRINIHLRPAHMGRIGVQLEVSADGRVMAVIAADRPETLDLLQRDARSLERALQDAGLRADSGSLSFNLSGRDRDETPQPLAPGGADPMDDLADPDEPHDPLAALTAGGRRASGREGGIDIHV
jgi:flagellar hook-length control protein FliK